jgi:hypothetical protein
VDDDEQLAWQLQKQEEQAQAKHKRVCRLAAPATRVSSDRARQKIREDERRSLELIAKLRKSSADHSLKGKILDDYFPTTQAPFPSLTASSADAGAGVADTSLSSTDLQPSAATAKSDSATETTMPSCTSEDATA